MRPLCSHEVVHRNGSHKVVHNVAAEFCNAAPIGHVKIASAPRSFARKLGRTMSQKKYTYILTLAAALPYNFPELNQKHDMKLEVVRV